MPEIEFDEAFAPPGCFDRKHRIDAGDAFLHRPSGETLSCSGSDGDAVFWEGWPEGYARVEDCDLVREATPDQRRSTLVSWSKVRRREGGFMDMRSAVTRRRLGISAREEAAAARQQRIDAIILLVQDARAKSPGRTAEIFRAARMIGRPDEADEAILQTIGEKAG